MAWSKVQENKGTQSTSGTTFGVAFTTANITSGNRILVAVSVWNSPSMTVTSVTDSAGNVYNGPVKRVTESDGTDVTLWDAQITAGGGTKPTVTAHGSGASSEWALIIREYSGLTTATASYTDGVNGAVGGTGNASSGASSPVATASSELAYGVYGDGGNNDTVTVGAGWSDFLFTGASSSVSECAVESQNSTNGSASTATFTLSPTGNPWGAIVAIYKLAAAGGAPAFVPQPTRRRQAAPGTRRRTAPVMVAATDASPATGRPRIRALATRRRITAQPVPPQAAANTNQPVFVDRQPRRRPPAAVRRARVTVPPSAVDVVFQSARRARAIALRWWRSRSAVPPAVDAGVAQVQRQRVRPAWVRRVRAAVVPLTQAAAAPNPAIADLGRRLARKWPWLRRAKVMEAPWPQAAATPNPPIVDLGRRLVRRWPWQRRGKSAEPPWGQAAANTNQALLVVAQRRPRRWPTLRRVRVPTPPPSTDAPRQAARPRRSPAAARRIRSAQPPWPQVVLAAPTWVPSTIRRAGRLWPWIRRRLPAWLPLAPSAAPPVRDIGLYLGDPLSGWTIAGPASGWSTYDLASGWTIRPPENEEP